MFHDRELESGRYGAVDEDMFYSPLQQMLRDAHHVVTMRFDLAFSQTGGAGQASGRIAGEVGLIALVLVSGPGPARRNAMRISVQS